ITLSLLWNSCSGESSYCCFIAEKRKSCVNRSSCEGGSSWLCCYRNFFLDQSFFEVPLLPHLWRVFGCVLSFLILLRAFRNSDKQSISELKLLPLQPKLSLFSPGKCLVHWLY